MAKLYVSRTINWSLIVLGHLFVESNLLLHTCAKL
jgi:hypothetical protein